MTEEIQLPHPSDELVAGYQLLLNDAIHSSPQLSVISLARTDTDEEPEPLHRGAVELAGSLAPTLNEPEALAAFIAVLRDTYKIPTLTRPQSVVFIDFATFRDEVTAAEKRSIPVTVHPNGGLWTIAGGYPALWLGGDWRLFVGNAQHDAASLPEAIELGTRFLRGQHKF